MNKIIYLNVIVLFVISLFISTNEQTEFNKYNYLKQSTKIATFSPINANKEEFFNLVQENDLEITIDYFKNNKRHFISNSTTLQDEFKDYTIDFNLENIKDIDLNQNFYVVGNQQNISNFNSQLENLNYVTNNTGYISEELYFKTTIFLIGYFIIVSLLIYFSFITKTKLIAVYLLDGYSRLKVYFNLIKNYLLTFVILYIISIIYFGFISQYLILLFSLVIYVLLIHSSIFNLNIIKGLKQSYSSKLSLITLLITKYILRIVILIVISFFIFTLVANINNKKVISQFTNVDNYSTFSIGLNKQFETNEEREKYINDYSKQFYLDTVVKYDGILIDDVIEGSVFVNDNYIELYNQTAEFKIDNSNKSCDLILVPDKLKEQFDLNSYIDENLNLEDPLVNGEYLSKCSPSVKYYEQSIKLNAYNLDENSKNYVNKIIFIDNTHSLPSMLYNIAFANNNYMLKLDSLKFDQIDSYDSNIIRNITNKKTLIESKIEVLNSYVKSYQLLIIIISFIYVILVINVTTVYFKLNKKVYLIKHIDGINKYKIHLNYLIVFVIENITLLLLSLFVSKIVLVIVVISIAIELIINLITLINLYNKQLVAVLKGDDYD